MVSIHPHAAQRAKERGTEKGEITEAVSEGEEFPAKYDRTGFRKNFNFDAGWNNRPYATKQIEAWLSADW